MKKLGLILGLLLICSKAYCADIQPKQLIEIENSGGIAIVQKQPNNECQMQVIKIKKSGGFLLVQINGKIKDSDASVSNTK